MGNSTSNDISQIKFKTDFQKLTERFQFNGAIYKDNLYKIFCNFDNTFINCIYNFYAPNDEGINETEFNEILDNFKFKSSENLLRYLLSIYKGDLQVDLDKAKLILNWISLSASNDFADIILTSYMESLDEFDKFAMENFINWIDRNLPDLGLDFSKCVCNALNCDIDSSVDLQSKFSDVLTEFDSSIINLSDLLVLFGCLPMVYKTCAIIEELYIQHCKHWILLYNSNVHGLSSSRLKDKSFDYGGPLLVIFQSKNGVFCLASDAGLREDWNVYGDSDTRFMQLRPFYQKYLSGSRAQNSGVIYSHFTAKSGRRGLFVGHNPLKSAALELNEDCNAISVMGKSQPLVAIEVWAVGFDVGKLTAKLYDIRHWEKNEVDKYKNRKIQSEKWKDNPDRDILDWGGVNVRHTDFIGGIERNEEEIKN